MLLYQGRKKFESIKNAQKELDPAGRRICLHNDELVVTIRPLVVQTFPGTVEQLFELGLKLGGTPIEVWIQNKKRCEDIDARKELALAKILQLMEQGFNAQGQLWKSRLTEYLRSLIELGLGSSNDIRYDSFEKVSDLLLSFVVPGEAGKEIVALQRFSIEINNSITDDLGLYVVTYLLQSSKELMTLIRDPYSPYFNSNWESILDPNERNVMLYRTLLEQPDLKTHHMDVVNRIKKDLYDLNPILLKEVRNRANLPLNTLIPESKEEWNISDFLRDISKDALLLLLSLYFDMYNPLSVAHNSYLGALMMKDVLTATEDIINVENNVQEAFIKKVDGDIPLLRELISKLELNKEFMFNHIIDMEEQDEEMDFDLEDLLDEEEDDFDERILHFMLTVLEDSRLSWKAKALYAYVFFEGFGSCDIQSLVDKSSDNKQALKSGLKELEKQEYGFCDKDMFSLYLQPEEFDDDLEDEETLEEFSSVLENSTLSWKAKGMALFSIINGPFLSESILLRMSGDSKQSIKEGLKELQDCKCIDIAILEEMFEDTPGQRMGTLLMDNKDNISSWYHHELRTQLHTWLQVPNPSIHLINAIYPSMRELTALEMAVIADDVETVERLIILEGINLPLKTLDKLSITQTALICGSYCSLRALLNNEQVRKDQLSMFMTVVTGISEEIADLSILRDILNTGVDLNCILFSVPSPLQLAIEKKKVNLGLVRLLLEFGASPNMEYVGPTYETLTEYVDDHGTVTLKKLFRNNTKSA